MAGLVRLSFIPRTVSRRPIVFSFGSGREMFEGYATLVGVGLLLGGVGLVSTIMSAAEAAKLKAELEHRKHVEEELARTVALEAEIQRRVSLELDKRSRTAGHDDS